MINALPLQSLLVAKKQPKRMLKTDAYARQLAALGASKFLVQCHSRKLQKQNRDIDVDSFIPVVHFINLGLVLANQLYQPNKNLYLDKAPHHPFFQVSQLALLLNSDGGKTFLERFS